MSHDAITCVTLPSWPNLYGQTGSFHLSTSKVQDNICGRKTVQKTHFLAQHCIITARALHIEIMSAVISLCKTGYLLTKLATCCWSTLSVTLLQLKLPTTWPITLVLYQSPAVAVADLDDIRRSMKDKVA